MSADLTPVNDPPWHDQDEEKDLKEHVDLTAQDAFGNEEEAEVKYKVLSWWKCGLLMVAETISLGVLSLPAVVATIGLVPALIILAGIGAIATYTGYLMGQFKLRYPFVTSMADAGEVLLGRFGRELFGIAQLLFFIFFMASHLVTFSVAFNVLTGHGTCTIVFVVVGLVISFICSLPRTLNNVSWLSIASFTSVTAAVIICMISLGVQHPGGMPIKATVQTDLVTAFTAVNNIVFAYIGHVAWFGIMAELKDPRDFTKALTLLQVLDITIYIIVAAVTYNYAGSGVGSPALSSTSPVMQKVAYGIALPTIIIAGVIFCPVGSKYIYLRVFAGTDRVHKRDFIATGSWIVINLGMWIIAWIIAEAVPVFDNLLSLISSIFGSWFSFGIPAIFWLYMYYGEYTSSWKKMLITLVNLGCIGIAGVICGLGLYASGKAIHDNPSSESFSCKNNA
ncbi:hypothetical protein PHISCL_03874 [Aspergillus sclerotialis]|uniref:Amino acid transporter transmembrane domain-containing protein n=1 Tax=Aspergillus sclerotialis TaxID=2070753 RepID=A0A3A2ZKQ5_9EURO|nr:hypothetical protein PHISCL_03874 [Aspergillus sclerotialis]